MMHRSPTAWSLELPCALAILIQLTTDTGTANCGWAGGSVIGEAGFSPFQSSRTPGTASFSPYQSPGSGAGFSPGFSPAQSPASVGGMSPMSPYMPSLVSKLISKN